MATVIEQWEKSGIQPAERTDTQNHVQQQKCRGACGANDERLGRCIGKQQDAESYEQYEVGCHTCDDHCIVDALLSIPTNGLVLVTHGWAPTENVPSTCFCA